MVLDKSASNWDLSTKDRQAVEDYDTRRSGKVVDDLLRVKQQSQPYRGAGVVLR